MKDGTKEVEEEMKLKQSLRNLGGKDEQVKEKEEEEERARWQTEK